MSEYNFNKKDIIQDDLFKGLDELNKTLDNSNLNKTNTRKNTENTQHSINTKKGITFNRTRCRIYQLIFSFLITGLGCISVIYCIFTSINNINYFILLGLFCLMLIFSFFIKFFDISRVCPICGENHALSINNVSKEQISKNRYNSDDGESIYESSTSKNKKNISCKYCSYSENIEDIEYDEEYIGMTELGRQREFQREQKRLAEEQARLQEQQLEQERKKQQDEFNQQKRVAGQQQWEFEYNQRKEQERQKSIKSQQEYEERCRQQENERKEREQAEKQKRETIASATQNGDFVNVYNMNGTIMFSRAGTLRGWTNSTVSVEYRGFISTYNAKGSLLYSRAGK